MDAIVNLYLYLAMNAIHAIVNSNSFLFWSKINTWVTPSFLNLRQHFAIMHCSLKLGLNMLNDDIFEEQNISSYSLYSSIADFSYLLKWGLRLIPLLEPTHNSSEGIMSHRIWQTVSIKLHCSHTEYGQLNIGKCKDPEDCLSSNL